MNKEKDKFHPNEELDEKYFQLELDRFKNYLKSDQRKWTNNQILELSYIGE